MWFFCWISVYRIYFKFINVWTNYYSKNTWSLKWKKNILCFIVFFASLSKLKFPNLPLVEAFKVIVGSVKSKGLVIVKS